jgi:hypothetical protein
MRQLGGGGRNKREGWMTQGNQVVDDTKRGPQGPNAAMDNTTRGGRVDNARHVACNGLPQHMIDIMLNNSMLSMILRLTL